MRVLGSALAIGMLASLASSVTSSIAQQLDPRARQQTPQQQTDPMNPIVLEDCVNLYKEGTQARLDCEQRNARKSRGKGM
jgi:hypothetical protein